MFVRVVSGCFDYPDELEPDSQQISLLEQAHQEAHSRAMPAYQEFLRSRDFSTAGDLLPYFGLDFFHDSPLEDIRMDGHERTFSFHASTFVLRDDKWIEVEFTVTFNDVAWLDVAVTHAGSNFYDYLYAEIDGLDAQISEARERLEGDYHSLTIQTGHAGWIRLVFGSVEVDAVDRVRWLGLLRDPNVEIPSLFVTDSPRELGTSS